MRAALFLLTHSFLLLFFYLKDYKLIFAVIFAMWLLLGVDDLSKGKCTAVCRTCTPEKEQNIRKQDLLFFCWVNTINICYNS